jgi:hypothetical protein
MMKQFSENLEKIGAIDFRNNRMQLIWSYILRFIGLIVFGGLFLFVAVQFNPGLQIEKESFLSIAIPGLSPILSILLIVVDVLLVLYIHELIHATVFFLSKGQSPEIGIRGLVIYAKAPTHYVKRNIMIINGLAPFLVISIIGIIFMVVLPDRTLPWIFIPIVINAAAAGGDFMIVAWMIKHSKEFVYQDEGDIITAYKKV